MHHLLFVGLIYNILPLTGGAFVDGKRNIESVKIYAPNGTRLKELFDNDRDLTDKLFAAITETQRLWSQGLLIPGDETEPQSSLTEDILARAERNFRKDRISLRQHLEITGPHDKQQRRDAIWKLEERVNKNWETVMVPSFAGRY